MDKYIFFFLIILCLTGIITEDRKLRKGITWAKALGITTPIYFILNAFFQNENNISFIDFEKFHNLPHYLILLATIITAYYIYQTLQSQRKADDEQRKANEIAAFENRFFKFIDYHRDNVDKIIYRRPNDKDGKLVSGKQYFVVLHTEMKTLLRNYFEKIPIQDNQEMQVYLSDAINFVYYCLFYGMWPFQRDQIEAKFKLNKNERFKELELDKISMYSVHYDVEKSKKKYQSFFDADLLDKKPYPFYTGHVNRLGNYFRNIYQAIKYVDEVTFLNENEKYDYMKIFRAQMSAYEQAMLFYNSLSDLGKPLEFEQYKKKVTGYTHEQKTNVYKKLYITKYDLIRNTPFIDTDNIVFQHNTIKIRITDFYHLLCNEHTEECSITGVLPFKDNEEKICRLCFNEKYIGYTNKDMDNKIRDYFNADNIFDQVLLYNIFIKMTKFKCDQEKCKSTIILKELKYKYKIL